MDCFKADGIYKRVGDDAHLYMCRVSHNMAKLIEYRVCGCKYVRTGNQYFLDLFTTELNTFKTYMINPNNYEQIGKRNVNFIEDGNALCVGAEKS